MTIAIQIDEELYLTAQKSAKGEYRHADAQIAFWARLGKAALDNPDLPIEFIREILISKQQGRELAEPFIPETYR
jgi:ParD-like antitoxin of type II bacterial toxin-antitoxin system